MAERLITQPADIKKSRNLGPFAVFAAAVTLLVGLMFWGVRPDVGAASPRREMPTEATPQPQNWEIESNSNAVTGEVTAVATLQFADVPNLVIRRVGRKLECYLTTDDFLETAENADSRESSVHYRFDEGPVISQAWLVGANNETLFYPGNCSGFVRKLRVARELAFEYRPSDTLPKSTTFDVAGFPPSFKTEP